MFKFKTFLKERRKIIYSILFIIITVVVIFIFNKNNVKEEVLVVKTADFIGQVSASGKVISSESVDLGFKNSGLIEKIYFSVDQLINKGNNVKAGALIAELDTTDAKKAVRDAETNLQNAKLSLEKLKIQNSNENLNTDLIQAYDDGFNTVSSAFIDMPIVVTGLDDLFAVQNLSENEARVSGNTALDYRRTAEVSYYKAKDVFEKNRIKFRLLDRYSDKNDIENIIYQTYDTTKVISDALKDFRNFVDYIAEDTGRTSEYTSSQDILSNYINTINGHLSNLLTIKTTIKDNKDAFINSDLDIQSSMLSVKQKENALQDAKNTLADYYIKAPFDGIITKIDAKVGEIAYPNVPLITMMGIDTFQIESFIPEVHISKIKLGDEADVTLDAYGENVVFKAQIISIDPAETIRDGVSTYKVKFQFKENDERIKSGMTANIAVISFSKPNTIVVPGGIIFDKNGKKFIQVKENKKILEREVVTGSVSSLNQVEIISGLTDGEVVILNPILK